jgi:ketosteroid isomerase-like protein
VSSAKATAQKFIENIEGLKFLEAFGMLAEDGRYIVIGTTKASRVYRGRQDVFDNLIPLLSTFKEPPLLKFELPIVDGERAVLLASGVGIGPTGPYHQPYYAFATRVRGDEFAEIIEFADTVMLETAIFGRKLVPA